MQSFSNLFENNGVNSVFDPKFNKLKALKWLLHDSVTNILAYCIRLFNENGGPESIFSITYIAWF